MKYIDDKFIGDQQLRIIQKLNKTTSISPQAILVEVSAERANYALALPKASECALQTLTIRYVRGSYNVTVRGSASDMLPFTEIVLGKPEDYAVLWSTGRFWRTLSSQLTVVDPDIVLQEDVAYIRTSSETTAYTMTITKTLILVTTTSGNTLTLTLPGVAASVGLIFMVKFISDGGSNVTITDAGDDGDFVNITLTSAGDYAIVSSDGTNWTTLWPVA